MIVVDVRTILIRVWFVMMCLSTNNNNRSRTQDYSRTDALFYEIQTEIQISQSNSFCRLFRLTPFFDHVCRWTSAKPEFFRSTIIFCVNMSSQRLLRTHQLQRVMAAMSTDVGYDAVMGLTSHQLAVEQIRWDPPQKTLTVSVPVTERIVWETSSSSSRILLSTYLSMVDDVSTWALFESDIEHGRTGVSLSLSAQNHAKPHAPPPTELEIAAQVTKIGKHVAFMDTTIRDAGSKQIVSQVQHLKYLNSLGSWIKDWAVTKNGWDWAVWWYNANTATDAGSDQECSNLPTVCSVFEPLKATNPSSKAFHFTASPLVSNELGTLHGGAHATLVQLAAEKYLGSPQDWMLDSIEMEYWSAASLQQVRLVVISAHSTTPHSMTVTVHLVNSRGRKSSGGRCHFVRIT